MCHSRAFSFVSVYFSENRKFAREDVQQCLFFFLNTLYIRNVTDFRSKQSSCGCLRFLQRLQSSIIRSIKSCYNGIRLAMYGCMWQSVPRHKLSVQQCI